MPAMGVMEPSPFSRSTSMASYLRENQTGVAKQLKQVFTDRSVVTAMDKFNVNHEEMSTAQRKFHQKNREGVLSEVPGAYCT